MASWPVPTIREKFFSYFEIRDYKKLSPNPVIIVDDKTPLIDTYLNHCKRTVNDTVRIDSRSKTFYSLRCIDVGNDDDVTMDSFFNDSSHHCMTEVLGSWASGDCKQEAIRSSWELLTQTYKLPRDRIYIKYFGGSKESCLDPDLDSFNMWKRYVPAERILPSSTKADFWSASDTGPCGPSVGIMFDLSDNKANPTCVANINDDRRFIEIWRLVFVQFNRQEDRLLRPLSAEHVITGLNIESLATVLQNKTSLYDSDVFKHILEVIHYGAGDGIVKYSGKVGNEDNNRVDAAYRVVANHLRSIAATTSYCAEYGLPTGHREDLLKHTDRRALVFGHKILDTKLDRYETVVKNAVQMAGFYPIQMDIEKINTIVEDEVKIYKKIRAEDEQGILSVECNPAMTNSNLHPSLPPRKKERGKPKNQTGKKKNKQQQQKRPPQLPPASVENEENTAQLSTPSVEDEDDATQLPPESVKNEDDATQLPLASVKNEDNKVDEIDGPVTGLVRDICRMDCRLGLGCKAEEKQGQANTKVPRWQDEGHQIFHKRTNLFFLRWLHL